MLRRKVVFGIPVLALVFSLGIVMVVSAVFYPLVFPNTGKIITVGLTAYKDSTYTTLLTSLSWRLARGSSQLQTIYLNSTSNVNAILNLTVLNWSPISVKNYLKLTWNQEHTTLSPAPNGKVAAVINLTALSSTPLSITSFSFDINITATDTGTP
jgi:hypothetical protein